MTDTINQSRRGFLKASAAAGGGLLIGFDLSGCADDKPAPSSEATSAQSAAQLQTFEPNAWLRIGSDDSVTVQIPSAEMGQGISTAIAMLVAEELDADWSRVRAQFAPHDAAYFNPLLGGQQRTGGSTSIRAFWTPLRQAGAAAREMLIQAAAARWGVSAESCRAKNGAVVHADSDYQARYGELAEAASKLPVPEAVFLKEPSEFRILGTARKRLDTPEKVDGSAVFGQDVRLDGLLTATVLRSPVFGGTVKSFDDSAARAVKGVHQVTKIDGGIAVIADDFWSAKRGRDALKVVWDEGEHAGMSSAALRERFKSLTGLSGIIARDEGDTAAAFKGAKRMLSADYEAPYLAHACMEPMNCTAHVRKDACDIWTPTQAQTGTFKMARQITGLPGESIKVHTTFLGGGFGRRGEQDFTLDALQCSQAAGAPVKVMWTREDDMQHDFYRPMTYNRLSAALDSEGKLSAWTHDIVGQSILARALPSLVKDGMDFTSIEGAANIPYSIPNLNVVYAPAAAGVPVGFWRSVGSSQNAYITECFMDEVADMAKKDPLEFRLALMANHPRHKAVLELAAGKAAWGKPPAEGRYRGVAVAESFGSYVAQVAEISIEDDKRIRVHKVVCAIDCGLAVNPSGIEAQMQSGIVYGLTAALMGEISIENGRVQQSNFHDYPLLRMDQMPEVEVHIVKSAEPPTGVGEPGTPPIAPAVANAVFAATGKPVRSLPIRL